MIKIQSQLHVPNIPDYRELNDRLTALCTFANPKYIEAKRQGRRAFYIEKEIYCYNETDDLISYPAGMVQQLDGQPVTDETNSNRVGIPAPSFILRDYQQTAVTAARLKRFSTLVAPTGAGKTILAIALIHARQQRTIILVHTQELQKQWRSELSKLLKIEENTVGIIGAGKWKEGPLITVAMIQTLSRNLDKVRDLDYGLMCVDEAHHIPSTTALLVANNLNTRFRLALTATPERRDGLHGMLYAAMGQVVAEVPREAVLDEGGIVPVVIEQRHLRNGYEVESWGDYITAIVEDEDRSRLIAKIAVDQSAPTLVLTDRTAHAEELAGMIPGAVLLHGGLKKSDRAAGFDAMESAQVVIGTTGLLGEGLDVRRLSVLILATPISSRTKLLQSVGRVIRAIEGKDSAMVIDIIDANNFALSSSRKRSAIYNEMGWSVN